MTDWGRIGQAVRRCGNTVAWAAALATVLATACGDEGKVTPPESDSQVDTATADAAQGDATTPNDAAGSDDGQTTDSGVPDGGDSDASGDADSAADSAGDATTDSTADTDSVADTADKDSTVSDATAADSAADGAADGAGDGAGSDTGADAGSLIVQGQYPSTCTSDSDCANPCTVGATCNGGTCSFVTKANACLLDIGNGKVECMAVGSPSAVKPCLACQQGPKGPAMSANLWKLGLDGANEGVQLTDIYKTGITWNYSAKRAVAGGKSLYFGDPLKGTYNNNKQVGGLAVTPSVAMPKDGALKPRLAFWLWLDTEETAGDDLLTVLVVSGGTPSKVWTSDQIGGTTHGNWQRIYIDLGQFVGQDVQFQLAFETKDGTLNAYEGAYVDELALATSCCAGNADCDDGNACTVDACKDDAVSGAPLCSNTAKAECCSSDADCNDNKPCTLDLCSGPGGSCSHSDKPGCCVSAADCNDNDSCTEDLCPAAGGACSHISSCCKSDAECNTGDPCKKGVCSGGQCSYTDTCCAQDLDCDDFNPCTKDACDKGKCTYTAAVVPGCCAPNVLTSGFNGSDEGWTFASTQPQLTWSYKETANAKSAPGVLRMGEPAKDSLSIPNAGGWKVTAISPAVTVLQGKETTLTFWALAPAGAYTSFTLRAFAVVDGVEQTFTSISGFTLLNTWKQFTVDLTPLGGKSFELRFEYKPTTSSGTTTGPGIYLDDVQVTSTCKAKVCTTAAQCGVGSISCLSGVCSDGQCSYANSCCSSNSDCNDGSLCTADSCVNGKCSFSAIKGCCMGAGDCNDGNACTADVCPQPGAQCQNLAVAGCCLSSAQCDDKNACTADSCLANKCVNTNTCCSKDSECDDGESKCTIDKCVAQKCVFTPTGAPGCCVPEVFVNDFDQGDLKGMTIANGSGAGKGWQINASPPGGLAKTPPSVLWYGDPAKGNYDFGANSGKASTAKIQLPAATPSSLSLWLYMDTESGTSFDKLEISVLVNGQKTVVFNKGQGGFSVGAWYEVKADLSKFQGQEISVEFDFNTGDSIANSGKGVFIDDLKVLTNCGG